MLLKASHSHMLSTDRTTSGPQRFLERVAILAVPVGIHDNASPCRLAHRRARTAGSPRTWTGRSINRAKRIQQPIPVGRQARPGRLPGRAAELARRVGGGPDHQGVGHHVVPGLLRRSHSIQKNPRKHGRAERLLIRARANARGIGQGPAGVGVQHPDPQDLVADRLAGACGMELGEVGQLDEDVRASSRETNWKPSLARRRRGVSTPNRAPMAVAIPTRIQSRNAATNRRQKPAKASGGGPAAARRS